MYIVRLSLSLYVYLCKHDFGFTLSRLRKKYTCAAANHAIAGFGMAALAPVEMHALAIACSETPLGPGGSPGMVVGNMGDAVALQAQAHCGCFAVLPG